MVMHWVLIVVFWTGGASAISADFQNKKSCELALEEIRKDVRVEYGACFEKG